MNTGLMPRCANCNEGYTRHVKGRACDSYKAKNGLAPMSDGQKEDMVVFEQMREEDLSLQHELYGETRCEAKGKLKHICMGKLVLDHVNLKKTHADKFSLTNTQILCEVANGLKGSKRTDYRTPQFKKLQAERHPGVWEGS